MSRPPDYMYKMSEALSEVMDDIGVNEKIVMKRRRSCDLIIALQRLGLSFSVTGFFTFYCGSLAEGSTTIGLSPDLDLLCYVNYVNVIQHMWEWKPESIFSVMMIQNENISPGYCYLQLIYPDIPETADSIKTKEKSVIDSEGRILMVNTWICQPNSTPDHGPAYTTPESPAQPAKDVVPSFWCQSSPLQAAPWLKKLTESKWPSENDKSLCRNAGCFLVSASSKLSDMPEYEWRISTNDQERSLMLCLNITQLRCYVLMKMILKTHINPHVDDVLSSFMCKNVLLYCVYNSSHESSQEWHTGNLLSYLHLCLFMLKERILQRNCPLLMIPGNNLLAGRMTDAQRGKLLDIIDNLMEDKEELLYKIQFDELGRRLMEKLSIIPSSPELQSATDIATKISANIIIDIAIGQSQYVKSFLMKMYNENLEVTQQNMSELLSDLKIDRAEGNLKQETACDLLIPLVKSALGSVMASIGIDAQAAISDEVFAYLKSFLMKRYNENLEVTQQNMSELLSDLKIDRAEGNLKQQTACDLLIPLVKSALGSVMASISIDAQAAISDEAFAYLEAGRESDVLSGRLKLVSVLYCTGDNERAERELKISQKQYNRSIVQSLCACFPYLILIDKDFYKACDNRNEEAIKYLVAFCIRFLNNEINCVPHELRYEILKSYIEEDRKMRRKKDSWMDYIAVDSVPYLYFLQYKTYGRLQRRKEQEEALLNLLRCTLFEEDL